MTDNGNQTLVNYRDHQISMWEWKPESWTIFIIGPLIPGRRAASFESKDSAEKYAKEEIDRAHGSIQVYLRTQAIEDVQALLDALAKKDGHPYAELSLGSTSDYFLFARPSGAWTEIECRQHQGELTSWFVYFTKTASYFVVSDRAETVTEVIKATALDGDQAPEIVHQIIETGVDLEDCLAPGLRGSEIRTMREKYQDLPAAITAVLTAVAKVRARLLEEAAENER